MKSKKIKKQFNSYNDVINYMGVEIDKLNDVIELMNEKIEDLQSHLDNQFTINENLIKLLQPYNYNGYVSNSTQDGISISNSVIDEIKFLIDDYHFFNSSLVYCYIGANDRIKGECEIHPNIMVKPSDKLTLELELGEYVDDVELNVNIIKVDDRVLFRYKDDIHIYKVDEIIGLPIRPDASEENNEKYIDELIKYRSEYPTNLKITLKLSIV